MSSDRRITDAEIQAAAMAGQPLALRPSQLQDRYDGLDLIPCMRCQSKLHVEITPSIDKRVGDVLADPRAVQYGITLERLRSELDRPELTEDDSMKTGAAMLCCDTCGLFEDASQDPADLFIKAVTGTLNVRKIDSLDLTQLALSNNPIALTREQVADRYDDMPLIPCPQCGGKLWVEMREEQQTVAEIMETEEVTLDIVRETTGNVDAVPSDLLDVIQPYVHCHSCSYVASGNDKPYPAD